MVECCIVRCSMKRRGNSVAEKDGEDSVAAEVTFCFVEGWLLLVSAFRQGEERRLLNMMSVFCMNVGLDRRGSRKPLAQEPATVTEVSCPSFAEKMLETRICDGLVGNLLMFGVMNIH